MIEALTMTFFVLMTACAFFVLVAGVYNFSLIVKYRGLRGPDPEPLGHFTEAELPRVTIQLPVYNEGVLAAQCLRLAAELDYPNDKLEIQFLDDSDDGVTGDIATKTIDELRQKYPDIVFQYFHRTDRTGFKAGGLKLGTENMSGDFVAIFDADFQIPRDYLRRTIHYFKDSRVGAVQARWDYCNVHQSLMTRLQANKLDLHQMAEQSGRARAGKIAIFHGTAGIWRAEALHDAGGWNCVSEVEDVEVTLRACVRGWRITYLDHYRVLSELPETISGYVRQQMRWRRGWSRIAIRYSGEIWRSALPWRLKLDFLCRLHVGWAAVLGVAMTMLVLPYFAVAEEFGLLQLAIAIYLASLGVSLLGRHFEMKTLEEDPQARTPLSLPLWLRPLPLSYLITTMGMLWPLVQATLEGFGKSQVWEVTPKSGTTSLSTGHMMTPTRGKVPGYVLGTLALSATSSVLVVVAFLYLHPIAALFYGTQALGGGYIGLLLLRFHGYDLTFGVLDRVVRVAR
ncbi:MAG: glycosyltransferase [Pseudomonadota bacterium]